jgi:predicted nuclease with TOPRIM domain
MTNEEMEIQATKRYGSGVWNADAIAMKIGFIEGLKFSQAEITRLKGELERLKGEKAQLAESKWTKMEASADTLAKGFAEWARKWIGWDENDGDLSVWWELKSNKWVSITTSELLEEYKKNATNGLGTTSRKV